DIYASRMDADGGVLEDAGLAVSRAAPSQASPAVAFDGENFLVVWEEDRSGETDIYGARVTASGSLLDGEGFAVTTAHSSQFTPAAAWDGSVFLVVWEDDRCGSPDCADLYGARVSRSGTVLDPDGIPISTATSAQFAPALAAREGGGFLVVWLDLRGS